MDLAVLLEIALNGNLGVVSGSGSNVLPVVIAGTSCCVVELWRRVDLTVAVQVVIVD